MEHKFAPMIFIVGNPNPNHKQAANAETLSVYVASSMNFSRFVVSLRSGSLR